MIVASHRATGPGWSVGRAKGVPHRRFSSHESYLCDRSRDWRVFRNGSAALLAEIRSFDSDPFLSMDETFKRDEAKLPGPLNREA